MAGSTWKSTRTSDGRWIEVHNRIPSGYTVFPTGESADIANGAYEGGEHLVMEQGGTTSVFFQWLDHFYAFGGRAIWEGGKLADYIDGALCAPATVGVEQAGNYDKVEVIPSSGLHVYVPNGTPGNGAWDLDLTAKLPNTEILKCVPVPVAGNTGFFNYDSEQNLLTLAPNQDGGYNLYDWEIKLQRFCSKCWGMDGLADLESSDVVGKLLFNFWKIKFELTAITAGAKAGIILTTAVKGNV